jgi:3-methyladenine DNA glycosylase AlkD
MGKKIENTAVRLKRRLRAAADPDFRRSQQRFFKEPARTLGLRTAEVRRLAAEAAREYRAAGLEIDELLEIADALWRSGIVEARALAVLILSKFHRRLERRHWHHLDGWVDSLNNWAETDCLCCDLFTHLIEAEPPLVDRLSSWTRSRNRWRRRAAAVTLVRHARRGEHHDVAFAICDRLAEDRDDMVEKAVGWLLKEASRTQPQRVTDYLLENIDRLSRTTVRYACEKLPAKLRARVMSA